MTGPGTIAPPPWIESFLEGLMDDHHLPQPGRPRPNHDGNALAARGFTAIAGHSRPASAAAPNRFEPPTSALGPLFRYRLEQIHVCRVNIIVDVNARPTSRVLGGYYRSRRLVRVYSHDRATGLRPLEELFETFLHEVAHHLEYTEPHKFGARGCHRAYGLMHSRLFWRIFGELKWRWANRAAVHLRRT
jgi:hypothetical protein